MQTVRRLATITDIGTSMVFAAPSVIASGQL